MYLHPKVKSKLHLSPQGPIKMHEYIVVGGIPSGKHQGGPNLKPMPKGGGEEALKKGYKQPTCRPKKEPKRPNGAFNDEPCHDM